MIFWILFRLSINLIHFAVVAFNILKLLLAQNYYFRFVL